MENDEISLTSNSEIREDAQGNSVEKESCMTKTRTASEDFIIVENPEFSRQPNPVLLSDVFGHTSTGVENDILPPPRTLDDFPRRRGKRKGTSNTMKNKRQKFIKTAENSDKSSSNNVQKCQNADRGESVISSDNNLPQSQTSEITDEPVVEVKRSTSYGLRRKFQSKDFSYDNDSFFQEDENDNDILVKPHVCFECQLRCRTKRELQQHQITSHAHYKCDLCGNNFTSLLGLKKHVHVKHSETEDGQAKTCACTECELDFTTEKELKHHQMSVHNKGKEHICDMCGKDYTSLLGLQKHITLKHTETECSFCNQKFKLGQALLDHMEICGRESMASDFLGIKAPKPKIFPCKICGKKFSEKGNRDRHIRIHQGILKFACEHCGKKCSEKQALLSHIRHIHTGERPYHCDMCPRSFATMSDLRRHQLTVHTDLRRFSCSHCGKAFKTREALKNHMKHESGEKLWQCGVCSKKFVTKGSLKAHMVVHTGIKMYECETCQRQFTHKGSLEAHVRVHTGLMPYICPECGKKFAHLQNRNRHVRTMHGNSEES